MISWEELLWIGVIMNNYQYERDLYQRGYHYIAGVDEVGRGPLAGPVVATAVIMPRDCYIEGVTDSKKLTAKKQAAFKQQIEEQALAISTIFIDERKIDEINIYQATKLAMKQAILSLDVKPDYILIDAMKLELDIPSMAIIKGDQKSFMIACASIIAKQARDEFMNTLDKIYPQYQFANHKGYPTKAHVQAIEQYGVLDIHRKTYAPVARELAKKSLKD